MCISESLEKCFGRKSQTKMLEQTKEIASSLELPQINQAHKTNQRTCACCLCGMECFHVMWRGTCEMIHQSQTIFSQLCGSNSSHRNCMQCFHNFHFHSWRLKKKSAKWNKQNLFCTLLESRQMSASFGKFRNKIGNMLMNIFLGLPRHFISLFLLFLTNFGCKDQKESSGDVCRLLSHENWWKSRCTKQNHSFMPPERNHHYQKCDISMNRKNWETKKVQISFKFWHCWWSNGNQPEQLSNLRFQNAMLLIGKCQQWNAEQQSHWFAKMSCLSIWEFWQHCTNETPWMEKWSCDSMDKKFLFLIVMACAQHGQSLLKFHCEKLFVKCFWIGCWPCWWKQEKILTV